MTMLVAIKPTVGRISRYGIIPITADQDTAGPMARTVADAAILLGALENASRPERSGQDLSAAALPRLHALSRSRCAQGRPHRHSARVLLRAASRRPACRCALGGLDPDEARRWTRPSPCSKSKAPSSSIPADIPSIVDQDPKPEFPALAGVSRRGRSEGHGCRLLGRLQVRE
jgi:amidase